MPVKGLMRNVPMRGTGGKGEAWEGLRFEVRSSKFSELRTQNFELCVALVPPAKQR